MLFPAGTTLKRGHLRPGRDEVVNAKPRALHQSMSVLAPAPPQVAAERPGLAAVEAEQREKPDCRVEVLDDKTDAAVARANYSCPGTTSRFACLSSGGAGSLVLLRSAGVSDVARPGRVRTPRCSPLGSTIHAASPPSASPAALR